jgi:hypothetical protein
MKKDLNINKISKTLNAKRKSKVSSKGGYFNALQLFLDSLYLDAQNNPDKLKHTKDVWDGEWEDLLKHVPHFE